MKELTLNPLSHLRIGRAEQYAAGALRAAIDQIRSEDFRAYLDAWRGYARALFDAYAREARWASGSVEEFSAALRWEIASIVEDILPERSPARDSLLPRTYVYFPGASQWERFMRFTPEAVCALESLADRKEVRTSLAQTLEGRAAHWTDQFQPQKSESGFDGQPPVKAEASAPAPEESNAAAAPGAALSHVSNASPPPAPGARGRPRGPSPDYKTAARVAAIVAPFGTQWRQRETLDKVLQALEEGDSDEEKIRMPPSWRNRNIHNWTDAGLDNNARNLARKAIQHYLALDARARKL